MKAALIGGALAATLWGGVALANGPSSKSPSSSTSSSGAGTGGSGDCATGGSSTTGSSTGSSSADCPDNKQQGSTSSYGGSQSQPSSSDQQSTKSSESTTSGTARSGTGGTGGVGASGSTDTSIVAVQPVVVEEEKEKPKADARGVTVLVGGGVEGYTGAFAPQINPGPTWGVGVALKPVGALGLELGYSGATNNLDESFQRLSGSKDADIVRNGGSAIGTIGLAPAQFQPYVLGGIGFDHYNVRNASDTSGYQSDNVGNVPLGLGFRTHVGHFTADARGVYGLLFNQGFAPGGNTDLGDIGDRTPDGRFQAQVRLGATF